MPQTSPMPRKAPTPQRLLTTVLFTDIVGSTERAAQVGDKEWRRLISAHHALIRRELKRFDGREVDTAGDGFFATFDQPAQAIRCAEAAIASVRRLGIEIRAGVHMGEVEVIGPKVGGIAVHIGARVMSKAGPGQVLVSSTVRDLMSGSELAFRDLGEQELKGVPAQWHLYAVEQPREDRVEEGPPLAGEEPARPKRVLSAPAIAVLALLVVAAVTVPTVLTLRRHAPGLPVPSVNTVVRIDAAAGKVEGAVPVGHQPGAAAADSGRVWVANFADGTVQSVDASTNVASPAIALASDAAPNAVTVGDGFVWVISSTTGVLYRIDPRQSHDIRKATPGVGIWDVTYGNGAIWITNNYEDSVLQYNPQDLTAPSKVIQLERGSGPKGIAVGGGAVWVAEGLKGRVARIDLRTLQVTATVPLLRGNPEQVAFGEGHVWVTDTEDDSVTRIDPSSNQGSTIPGVGNGPAGIAAAGGAVWVANSLDGTVSEIAPGTSSVTRFSFGSGLSPKGVAIASGAVWVSVQSG